MNRDTNEQNVSLAFSKQSAVFDTLYSSDPIIQYKRNRVRQFVLKQLAPGSSILELNAGTGDDAVFFASYGHHVHATDISAGMQNQLMDKVREHQFTAMISSETCSFTALHELKDKGPYDHIFSNFAGLNCTHELEKVLLSFDSLLKPGGSITLVVLPKCCLWETLLIFKGKFRTASRRFFSSNGRRARVEGTWFKCWYYSPGFIKKVLKDKFETTGTEGLCCIVPPSYIEHFAEKYPKSFAFLCAKENKYKQHWPWKYIGDYFIISLKKKRVDED